MSHPLPSNLLATAEKLNHNSQSVKAVLHQERNRFTDALEALQQLSIEKNIPIAIVGGLATIHFGYPAVTEDIDIAIAKSQLDQLVDFAPAFGFRVTWKAESGWHTLAYGEVELNIVPEGGKANHRSPTTIPGPTQLGVHQGLDYANLAGWLELKISSNRQKDRAHIVEVLKKTEASEIPQARNHLAQIHVTYLNIFDELASEAIKEKRQEQSRGKWNEE